VEAHRREQLQKLPSDNITTTKVIRVSQQPHQTEEEFDNLVEKAHKLLSKQEDESAEERKERVWDNPKPLQLVDNIEYFIPERILSDIFNKWLEAPYDCSRKLKREDIASLRKLSAKEPIKLSKVNTKWKAIILWALNTCSYNSDVINLTTDQLDLDNGYVSYIRTKKKVPKCGVMWDITIKAIKDRLAVRKGDSKYIFTSSLSMISKDNEAMQSWPTLSHYGIICGGFTRVADCTQVFTNKQGRSFLQETGRN